MAQSNLDTSNNLTIEQWIDYMESLETVNELVRFNSIIIKLGLDEYTRLHSFLEPEEMLSRVSIETQYIFTLILKQAEVI